VNTEMLVRPIDGRHVQLEGPNIVSLPEFEPLPDRVAGPVLLRLGDDISTDEIMPVSRGSRRSNILAMADFAFDVVDLPEAGKRRVTTVVRRQPWAGLQHAAIVPRT
jgi:aconitate hydratase